MTPEERRKYDYQRDRATFLAKSYKKRTAILKKKNEREKARYRKKKRQKNLQENLPLHFPPKAKLQKKCRMPKAKA